MRLCPRRRWLRDQLCSRLYGDKGAQPMLTRPSYILPSQLDICDPDFPAQCQRWTAQMRSEMQETITVTKQTLAESRTLMAEIDRVLARK